MNFRSIIAIALLFLLVVLQSCQKENADAAIDPMLQPYFEKFKTEAGIRGIEVNYVSLGMSGTLSRIKDPNVVGQCIHNPDQPNKIVISRSYWNRIDTVQKEFLIFHELGHCVLNRSHLDATDSHGHCLSIMHSSLGLCLFEFTGNSRTNYLNELFK